MKPRNVVFDCGGLIEGSPRNMGRAGLYIAGLEVLKAFTQDSRIRVSIFAEMPRAKIEAFSRQYLTEGTYTIHNNFNWSILLKYRIVRDKVRRAKEKKRWHLWAVRMIKKNFYAGVCKLLDVTFEKAFDGVDIWFSPIHAPLQAIAQVAWIKKFVVLHDVIPLIADVPPYNNVFCSSDHWHNQLVRALNTDDHYFADSDYTKRDFLKYVKTLDASKIHVAHLACSNEFVPCRRDMRPLFEKYRIPSGMRYVFSLCTIDPRKNLIRATKVFIEFIQKHQIEDLVLVLGGNSFECFIDQFNREVKSCGPLANRIVQTGYVDAADLPVFYSQAEWFVYTSQYEGFGLPPLEAMACGCPVVTSNATSLPEVVGDAGIMVDWESDEQHLHAYESYYFNPALRSEMARRGLERAKRFSWTRCAREMIDTMEEVCGNS
jgi:glycosyltransferase involved in cell wall biosynthesis